MALTRNEQTILDLHDAGAKPAAIALRLGLSLQYVQQTAGRYHVSLEADRKHESLIALGSKTLLRNVLAAGGHR